MKALRQLAKVIARRGQWLAAGLAIFIASLIAGTGTWVFRAKATTAPDSSTWQVLFSDSSTTGFVRLAVIAVSLYAIGSVAALVAGGRWMKALGAGGFHADEARASDQTIAELNARSEALAEQLLQLSRLSWRTRDG